MFLLKKLIAPLLFPVPIILLLIAIGLVRMYTGGPRRDRNRGRPWILAGCALLLILSFRPVPHAMMLAVERQYDPVVTVADRFDYVVVLSGGISDDPHFQQPHQLSTSTMIRLTEGIRIWRQRPWAKLVLSGGQPFSEITGAEIMRTVALGLGVPDSVIVTESLSMDTKDQAVAMARLIGPDPFVLVTSALHMPRSMALFRGQGLEPIPAPTDFLARDSQSFHPGSLYPSSLNLAAARNAWREVLGLVWAGLRGQT